MTDNNKQSSNISKTSQSSSSSGPMDELPPAVVKMGLTLGEYLGSGQFSKVYKVKWNERPDQEFVIKCFKFNDLNLEWKEKCLKNEMLVMKRLSTHPNIVKAFKFIKTRNMAFIIMEFEKNGNIADLLIKNGKPFDEQRVKKWSKQLFNALQFTHSEGIAHRDLKLENFLLDSKDSALISDFGFSCSSLNTESDRIMKGTQCGTAAYMAPELHALKDGHVYDAKASDVYSMGICLFEMLNFVLPFGEDVIRGSKDVLKKQMSREYTFIKKVEKSLSNRVKDLIHKLLEPEPNQRITAAQVLKHDFFRDS